METKCALSAKGKEIQNEDPCKRLPIQPTELCS